MMKRKYIMLIITMLSLLSLYAQQKNDNLPDTFLGYGWLVGFPYDITFILSERSDKTPTIEDYFEQKYKYGIRINSEDEVLEVLHQGHFYPIRWHNGGNDSLEIIPVMAYYSLYYRDISSLKRDTTKVKFEPYHEMLQVYFYKDKSDSVFYRFGMDYDIELRVIDR